MIVCNLFEVDAAISVEVEPIIDIDISTDLPSGARVIYSCGRSYLDSSGEESLWVGESGDLFVSDGSCQLKINVNLSDKMGYDLFQELYSKSPPISTPISDKLELAFSVGLRQRLKGFGPNNVNLSGTMVRNKGGINFVKVIREFVMPMKSSLQPKCAR